MPDHELALLDTSCVIDIPAALPSIASRAAVSTLTIAELAYGLHHADPIIVSAREARYRSILTQFDPIPYSSNAAHLYGAIAAAVRNAGRNPRPRRIDLLLASVAADLGAVLVTRNPDDFVGTERLIRIVAI